MDEMRGLLRRTRFGGVCTAVALASMLATAPARAEDGGLLGFLSSAFGGGGNQAPAAAPAPAPSEGEQVRPLTVRRSPRKGVGNGAARARFARLPTKTGPVSIFEDRTLRDGDAVMTKDGMKVFAGGRFSAEHPYEETDFIAVSQSKAVGPNLKKTVIELNKLPHS